MIVFRVPKFPLLCNAGGVLLGATSLADFSVQLDDLDLPPDVQLPVVDVSSEGWVFSTKFRMLSPIFQKALEEKEVIAMFNDSITARKLCTQYPERSVSAKRFDRILIEIVKLIRGANQNSGFMEGSKKN